MRFYLISINHVKLKNNIMIIYKKISNNKEHIVILTALNIL